MSPLETPCIEQHGGLIIHWKDRRPIYLQRRPWGNISTVPSKWIGFVKPSISFNARRTKSSDWEIIWTYALTPLWRLKHWAHLEICKMHMKSSNRHTKLASQMIKQRLEWGQERGKHLFAFLVSTVLCSKTPSSCELLNAFLPLIWFLFAPFIGVGTNFSFACALPWVSLWYWFHYQLSACLRQIPEIAHSSPCKWLLSFYWPTHQLCHIKLFKSRDG